MTTLIRGRISGVSMRACRLVPDPEARTAMSMMALHNASDERRV
jgi:hypothetical protein